MNIEHHTRIVVRAAGYPDDDRVEAERILALRWLYDVIIKGLGPDSPYPVTRDERGIIRIDHSLAPLREPEL